ncbi:MAG: MFS transporter [Sandaracinaceae bacterium]|nr:MFS transporter [Sandaracinaceae bacterium]
MTDRRRVAVDARGRATSIVLSDLRSPPMKVFHLSWMAFLTCFVAWFSVAPLMPLVREELGLTAEQIGTSIIASVAVTILARLLVGYACDRFGPRRTYAALLVLGAVPVACLGLVTSFETFLAARLAVGAVGASFVITQAHTSAFFAPNRVGTANATTAGWGNLGGGLAQLLMPLILAGLLAVGVAEASAWRYALFVPAIAMLLVGLLYLRVAPDAPAGAEARPSGAEARAALRKAARDPRVWSLFAMYGACFGVELTINNVAALHFHDHFGLDLVLAGAVASAFGAMNLFARTLGGWLSDRIAAGRGLRGRTQLLVGLLALEGVTLVIFSQMGSLVLAIAMLVVFSVFVQASEGATFAIVPLVDERGVGAISGIVGAGGNVGAVLAGFLVRGAGADLGDALAWLGTSVVIVSLAGLAMRFSDEEERRAHGLEATAGAAS